MRLLNSKKGNTGSNIWIHFDSFSVLMSLEIEECKDNPEICVGEQHCVEVSPELNPDGYQCLCPNGMPPHNDQCEGMYTLVIS